ncbi:MAG: helix-turn-helix transcriptional regulator [Burkholderiaceae bacterium]
MQSLNEGWRLNDTIYDQCVATIYSAASGAIAWDTACSAISRAFNLYGVHIIGVDKKTGQLLFSWESDGFPEQCIFDYVTQYHPDNPRLPFALSLQGDDWVHDHVLFDDEFVKINPFFQDYAIPYGIRYLSGTKLVDDDNHVAMFGAVRSPTQQPLNVFEIKELSRIRLHLVNAMMIRLKIHESFTDISVGQELLNSMAYPIFVTKLTGEILHKNPCAEKFFERNDFLMHDPIGFRLQEREADALFTQKLREINQIFDSNGRLSIKTFVVPIGRPVTQAAVIGIVVDPDESMRSFGIEPVLLAIVHEISGESSIDPFIVGKIFGLTPAESFVATHFANGGTTQSIAENRGVSEHTIRSQVRSIYAKIGISSHPELTHRIIDIPNLLPVSTGGI